MIDTRERIAVGLGLTANSKVYAFLSVERATSEAVMPVHTCHFWTARC